MNLQIVRPRVTELVFQLFARPLHPELFEIHAVHRVEREDCTLTIRITRSGHVISWENGKHCLTEVSGGRDEPVPQARRLLRYRLRGEHYGAVAFAPGMHYQMSFQVESLSPEVYLHVHDEILADATSRGFLHNFQPHHRLALAPLGFVAVEGQSRSLVIHTFHTFPDELTVVKSQSLIEQR